MFRKCHFFSFILLFSFIFCLTNTFADENVDPIDIEDIIDIIAEGNFEFPIPDGAAYIQGTPEFQKVLESIIGTNDFEKMRDLATDSQDYKLGRKVGMIITRTQSGGIKFCTGFLVGPDLFMTNHHCIDGVGSLPLGRTTFIYMDYYQDDRTLGGLTARASAIVRADATKDYALLRLDKSIGNTYGWLALDTTITAPDTSQSVKLMSHPGRRSKEIVRRNSQIVAIPAGHPWENVPFGLLYLADTQGGSSGSPVFLRGGTSVIGIHHTSWIFNGRPIFNGGTLMSYIVPEIKQWLPNASAPVRVATTLEVVNGNGQSARVDQRLANPLVVRVKDQNGAAMSGVSVSFSVTPGGTLNPSSATTGSNGEAETRLTLGGTPGTYTVTARASGITQSVTFTATATAPAPLAFSPNTIAAQTFTVGSAIQPLRLPIATGGTAPYTYSLSPIPAGLLFSSADRLLSGTPTTAATATSITYTVRDASGRSASLTFTITVAARPAAPVPPAPPVPSPVATALEVGSGNGQSARVNQRLANPLVVRVKNQNNAAMSGVSVSFSVTPGGTLNPSSATTGSNGEAETRLTLGGTPGTYTVTARASGITQSVTFTATATAAPQEPAPLAFSPNTIADQTFTVGSAIQPLRLPVATGGTAPYTYSLSPIPAGLSFSSAERLLSGTPTTAATATSLSYTVRDAAERSASLTFTIIVAARPAANITFRPSAIAAQTFTVGSTIQPLRLPVATGGTAPYTYSLSPIPAGLSFSSAERLLSGTPVTAATATSISYTVRDASGRSASLTFTITVAAPPDLVVGAPQASKVNLQPGESFSLEVSVRNQGAVTAPATTLRFYQSADNTITSADVELSTIPISALAPNGFRKSSIARVAPTSPGTYYYGACVDPVGDEGRIDNNCSTAVTITVGGKPRFNPNAIDDQTFVVNTPIEPLSLPIATGGTAPYTYSLSPIPAGLSFSSAERLLSGTPTTAATATSLSYTARDASGRSASLTFTITVTAHPDLVVESPEISSSDLQPGESFRLEVSVRNQGAVTAPATTLRFYQSADSTVTASDVEVGTTAVGSLTSGGSSGTSITLTAPVTPGTYYYGACVDAVGNERRTDNNCSTVVTITVRDPLDVNRDGQVDVLDLVRVAFLYGTRGTGLPEDVNTDGVVDLSDLTAVTRGIDAAGGINGLSLIELEAALLAVIEQMEAIEGLGKAPMRLTHVRVSYIAYANVAAALNDVKHLAIGDTRAVLSAFLRLLSEIVLIPKTTTLLPNYPNPFNPETWIPYQLAKAADVTLYIYAVDGPLVRILALGHQAAGAYQSRSRAAYWDGRNQLGEPVASGLYFYTLTAGDFTATRKMFIRK